MKTSDTITKIAPALLAAQKAITFAAKNSVNPHFRNAYADLPAVIDSIKDSLNTNGIVFLQSGSPSADGCLHLTTRLLHESGEWVEDTATCPLPKADPQGFGSAMTYLRRYSLAAICGLYQDDDDGEGAKPLPGQKPAASAAKPAPIPAAAERQASKPSETLGGGSAWRAVIVPKFIKKYAGKTLGEMEVKDVLWWADNFVPKPFGRASEPSEADIAFRRSLDVAKAELEVNQEDVPY